MSEFWGYLETLAAFHASRAAMEDNTRVAFIKPEQDRRAAQEKCTTVPVLRATAVVMRIPAGRIR